MSDDNMELKLTTPTLDKKPNYCQDEFQKPAITFP